MVHVLTTDRLRLRRLNLADTDDLLEVLGDPVAMAYYPGSQDRDGVAAWIRWAMDSYEANGFGLWAIERARRRRVPGRLRADAPAGRERLAARDRLPPPPSSYGSWLCHRSRRGMSRLALRGNQATTASAPSSTPITCLHDVWRSASIGRSNDHLGANGYAPVSVLDGPRSARRALCRGPARSAARISWLARRGPRRPRRAEAGRHRSAGMSQPPRRRPRPTASRRIPSSSRPARVPLRSMDRARNAPPKASPAPTVSSDFDHGHLDVESEPSTYHANGPRPVAQQDDGRAKGQQRPGCGVRGQLGRDIGAIVRAELDDIGARDDATQAVEVCLAVNDGLRSAVRIDHHEGRGSERPRYPLRAPRRSARRPARGCRGGQPSGPSAARSATSAGSRSGAAVPSSWKR